MQSLDTATVNAAIRKHAQMTVLGVVLTSRRLDAFSLYAAADKIIDERVADGHFTEDIAEKIRDAIRDEVANLVPVPDHPTT